MPKRHANRSLGPRSEVADPLVGQAGELTIAFVAKHSSAPVPAGRSSVAEAFARPAPTRAAKANRGHTKSIVSAAHVNAALGPLTSIRKRWGVTLGGGG